MTNEEHLAAVGEVVTKMLVEFEERQAEQREKERAEYRADAEKVNATNADARRKMEEARAESLDHSRRQTAALESIAESLLIATSKRP